ncbi:hypothetical protein N7539_001399 [Penicillium diatomitis]|uniref:Uncharacterized protein n=1 Tax=Penicillium diatomitis TaxID=2819901 RepID=A0A9X0BZQ3_9EURO|nr:uncharacterized protein N7539_001399 [Penicillium diatomitis]KAJ5492653.1 hypothetical protein N7539_001399 [Penicillium diatomitis]
MASPVSHNASSLLLEPLPSLNVPLSRTSSKALRRIQFVGALRRWANFRIEGSQTYNSQTWNERELAARVSTSLQAGSVDEEHVLVSDEHGVQSRFEGRAEEVLGVAFEAQNQDLKLGGFRGASSLTPGYKKVPDFVLVISSREAKVVGEVKVPWINDHGLSKAISLSLFQTGDEEPFQHLLGQIAKYMFDSRLKYGVLTTYQLTIFLRKMDFGRAWGLGFSPVIHHNFRGSTSGRTISLCQSFYHVGLLALTDSQFDTQTGLRNQR